jgi:hypothetical protein
MHDLSWKTACISPSPERMSGEGSRGLRTPGTRARDHLARTEPRPFELRALLVAVGRKRSSGETRAASAWARRAVAALIGPARETKTRSGIPPAANNANAAAAALPPYTTAGLPRARVPPLEATGGKIGARLTARLYSVVYNSVFCPYYWRRKERSD